MTTEKLYEQDVVEKGMVGSRQEVVNDIRSDSYAGSKLLPPNDIWGEYDKFIDTRDEDFWSESLDSFSDYEDVTSPPGDSPFASSGQDDFGPSANGNKPFESADEPGRNDLCPCGSGRKYKHCCME